MTELVHELAGLLDGSMRCLSLAARSFPNEATEATAAQLGAARRQMETVRIALERMAAALTRASGPYNTSLGPRVGGPPGAITLHEAAQHAADVCRPFAAERRVGIDIEVDRSVESEPAGAVYPLLLNGLRNACEAVAAVGGHGTVHLRIMPAEGKRVLIEIEDDGIGPPAGLGPRPDRAFERGYTTKDRHAGIGLGICRSVVGELGGEVTLERGAGASGRPGALLRAMYPKSRNRAKPLDEEVGGHG